MTPRLWPRSLAARTASVLLVGLIIVQAAGLAIHAFDRIDLQRLAQEREIAVRVMNIYRTVMLTPPDQREAVLEELRHSRTCRPNSCSIRRPRTCPTHCRFSSVCCGSI